MNELEAVPQVSEYPFQEGDSQKGEPRFPLLNVLLQLRRKSLPILLTKEMNKISRATKGICLRLEPNS